MMDGQMDENVVGFQREKIWSEMWIVIDTVLSKIQDTRFHGFKLQVEELGLM